MNTYIAVLELILICFLAFYLRIYPRLRLKNYGIDTWFYLLYIEQLRKTKRFPIRLSYYCLDKEEQWYPPGFPIALSIFSPKFLERFQWLLNPIIDCLQLLLLYSIVFSLTKDFFLSALSGIIYATTPTLISENTSLNSRGLANLIFTGLMLCLMMYVIGGNRWWLIPIILLGVSMLLTHKMVTQNFIFLMLVFTLCYLDVKFLIILMLIFIATVFLTKGFYFKILKGHIEILYFWKKNLHNLGAHQVYDSDIYEKPPNYSDRRFHSPGIMGIKRYLEAIILNNNNWYALFLMPFMFDFYRFSSIEKFHFYWLFWSYFLIILVTFVPNLKFLGESYKYVKFSVFPIAILFASIWPTNKLFYTVLFIILFLLNVKSIVKNYKDFNKKPQGNIDKQLMEIINYLKRSLKDGVMAISAFSADGIAYFSRKKVCWGGHSSGWNKLDEWFPVLKKPIEYFFKKYRLNYLLVDKDYVEVDYLNLKNFSLFLNKDKFSLYEWRDARKSSIRKINILYLITTLEIGGTERQILELAKCLDREKYKITICCFQGGPLVEVARKEGIRVEVLSYGKLKNPIVLFSAIRQLNRLMTNADYDILHAFLFHAYVIGSCLGWLNGIPVIINARRSLENFKGFFHLLVDRTVNNLTTTVVANSEAVKKDVVRRESLMPERIKVIYNGVDFVKYDISIDLNKKRQEFGINDRIKIVGIIGNLIPYKGHKEFLEAAKIVLEQFSEVKFLIVGRDNGIGEKFKNLVTKLGIEKFVIFTGQRLDIPEILQIIDIQVLPSYEEGFSNVILEGMAAGRPLIVSNVGGNPEVVTDTENGIIVPLKNYQELAEAIIKLLKNPHLAKKIGVAGQKRVRERFTLEKMVTQTENLYDELLKNLK